jgi:peroxiredoxin
MSCREEVAELRPHVEALQAQGNVAVIGSGTPAMAKAFAERMGLPKDLPVLSDSRREAYQLLGFTRSIRSTFTPRALLNSLRALRKGFRQGRVQGDPFQQGGTLVIAPSGEILFRYQSKEPGDHAAPDRLIAALRGA